MGIKNVERSFRILEKKVISRKDFWLMEGSHDGYITKYGLIHKRSIKYDIKNCDLFGEDTITYKKNFRENNFEIRFHLHPMAKVTKTVDKKIILIDIGVSGWKFSCENFIADVENGLFFGKKNSYEENKNIVIFGRTKSKIQKISWKIEKI